MRALFSFFLLCSFAVIGCEKSQVRDRADKRRAESLEQTCLAKTPYPAPYTPVQSTERCSQELGARSVEPAWISTREAQCSSSPQSCFEAGVAYGYGCGGETSKSKAVELLTSACEGNVARGCTMLSNFVSGATGYSMHSAEERALVERGCTLGDDRACAFLLGEKLHDDPSSRDAAEELAALCSDETQIGCLTHGYHLQAIAKFSEATVAFRAGCERGGDRIACSELASDLLSSKTQEEQLEAHTLLRAGCEDDIPLACADLASQYESGSVVDTDLGKAEELLVRGCQRNPEDCAELARFLVRHHRIDEAIRVAEYACQQGVPVGCLALTTVLAQSIETRPANAGRTANCAKRFCEEFGGTSCGVLGTLYKRGEGVEKDIDTAKGLYRKACDQRDALSCLLLGWLIAGDNDYHPEAHELFTEACLREVPEGCAFQAMAHASPSSPVFDLGAAEATAAKSCELDLGDGCTLLAEIELRKEQPNNTLVQEYLERACSLEFVEGCVALADAYQNGSVGLSPDATRAKQLYQAACDLGDASACAAAKL